MEKKRRKKRIWKLKKRILVFDGTLILIICLLSFNLYLFDKIHVLPEGVLLSPLHISVLIVSLIAITLLFVATFLSVIHRTIGALSRMEEILDEAIQGNYSQRITVRKKDILEPLAQRLNKVLSLLEEKK